MQVSSFKILVFAGLISFLTCLPFIFNSRTKIVFCSGKKVQSTLLIFPSSITLVNLGSGHEVVDCLQRSLSFYRKTIDYIILTDTRRENYGSLPILSSYYSIKTIISPNITTKTFLNQMKILSKTQVKHAIVNRTITLIQGRYKIAIYEAPDKKLQVQAGLVYHNGLIYLFVPESKPMEPTGVAIVSEFKDYGSSDRTNSQIFSLAETSNDMINSRQHTRNMDRYNKLKSIYSRSLLTNDLVISL